MQLAMLITAFVVAILPVAPTEPTLVGLGALAAVRHGQPAEVILIAGVACSLSDHMFFAAGRWGASRIPSWLLQRRATGRVTAWMLARVEHMHAPMFVAVRWFPGGGSVGAVLAGTLRRRLRWFTPTSLVGALLWSCYAVMLGFLGSTITGNPLAGLGISLFVATMVGLVSRLVFHRHVDFPRHLHTASASVSDVGATPLERVASDRDSVLAG